MDVLHFIKSHHDSLREGLARLTAAEGVKARRIALEELSRDLQVHLALEKDYLYPEIGDLFPGGDVLVVAGQASVLVISKRLKTLQKLAVKPAGEQEGWTKRLVELAEAMQRHFEQEEQTLMPKMRLLIRTEDREDLGQLFLDVQTEVLTALEGETVPQGPGKGRKRA